MAKVIYDPDLKSLTINLPASVIKIDHDEGFDFAATPGIGGEEWPGIFLSPSEIVTLGKMVEYVLAKLKISEQGRKDLEHVAEELGRLRGTDKSADERSE